MERAASSCCSPSFLSTCGKRESMSGSVDVAESLDGWIGEAVELMEKKKG
jgi:hypothetical protein